MNAAAIALLSSALLASDADLASLHADPRWPEVLAAAKAEALRQRPAHEDPERPRFVTEDVERFWAVYDQLSAAADPAALLEQEYLSAGTVGVQDFISDRILSGANLWAAIRTHPRFYASIRPATRRMAEALPAAREALRKFKAIYPEAVFPDLYFVVGALNSGGTASGNGLLFGAELFTAGPGTVTDELSPWAKGVLNDPSALPGIVAHELVHHQQKVPSRTVLEKVFKEGSADFLASLVTDRVFNARVYAYGRAHEAALWRQLSAELDGTDASKWLYRASESGDRPADVGYFMGFRIAEAYYAAASDKRAAVREIITAQDVAKLLRESRYAARFE